MDEWFLLKASGNEIFGPATLGQLRTWATEAKISPVDRVSNDGRKSWRRAPLVTELQMDWLVEMQDNFLYGPTSLGTLQEFLATGEIDENVVVINTLEGTQNRIKDMPFFQASPHRVRGPQEIAITNPADDTSTAGDAGTGLKQRCLWLERQVIELQREVGRWQETAQHLRQQFIEATGTEPR
jgi:hypothetical protein